MNEQNATADSFGPDSDADAGSTTGSPVDGAQEAVGRLAGQDVGYAGETGAERRAEAQESD